MWNYLKFRFKRQWHWFKKELLIIKNWAKNYWLEHIWGKWHQLGTIRRIIVIWWGLVVIIVFGLFNQYFALVKLNTGNKPIVGGEYVEGVVGKIKNINSILPENEASANVSKLIFSGLTKNNPKGRIEADLATSWSVTEDQRSYTFHLHRDIKWQDGAPFTSKDILFTITAIQNPDSRSPLATSWRGIKTLAPDDYTITFTLPSPDPAFIYSTTVGILPKHLLETVNPSTLKINEFNQKPIGTGPFKIEVFSPNQNEIVLKANSDYYGGKPYLNEVRFKFFNDAKQLLDAYAKHQILGARIQPEQKEDAAKLINTNIIEADTFNQTYLFLRNTQEILKDVRVRQALSFATSRGEIVQQLLNGEARVAALPLLTNQIGYDKKYNNATYNLAKAKKLLDAAGWKLNSGIRIKNGKALKFTIITRDGGNYPALATQIKDQWAKANILVDIKAVDDKTLQQSYIKPRYYDILLYGLNLGADPDVYPYWHSSQINNPGLNLAQYQNFIADQALAGARVVADPGVRAIKYHTFLSAWATDVPSIGLYSPKDIFIFSSSLKGITLEKLINPEDHLDNITQWYLKNSK